MKLYLFIMALMATVSCTSLAQQYKHTSSSGSGKLTHIKASRNLVNKEIRTADFSQIQLIGSADVVYEQKPGKSHVEVYTSDNIFEALDIKVEGGVLKVGLKKGYKISYNTLRISAQSPKINNVSVSGSGDITLKSGIQTGNMKLSIAGSGDVDFSNLTCSAFSVSIAGSGDVSGKGLACTTLDAKIAGSGDVDLENVAATAKTECTISGSGEMELKGQGTDALYRISGSGSIDACGFKTNRVEVTVAGSGDLKCYAKDYLKASVAGSGSVRYLGNPEVDAHPKADVKKIINR